jgi:hypothetical protein
MSHAAGELLPSLKEARVPTVGMVEPHSCASARATLVSCRFGCQLRLVTKSFASLASFVLLIAVSDNFAAEFHHDQHAGCCAPLTRSAELLLLHGMHDVVVVLLLLVDR